MRTDDIARLFHRSKEEEDKILALCFNRCSKREFSCFLCVILANLKDERAGKRSVLIRGCGVVLERGEEKVGKKEYKR